MCVCFPRRRQTTYTHTLEQETLVGGRTPCPPRAHAHSVQKQKQDRAAFFFFRSVRLGAHRLGYYTPYDWGDGLDVG